MIASAQDVIVKRDGGTILAKVLKVTQTEVEYKKSSNNNGPTYSIPVQEIMAINYENGEKDTFESNSQEGSSANSTTFSLNDKMLQSTHSYESTHPLDARSLSAYQEKEDLLRSARINKTWGTVCIVAGAGTALAGLLLSEGIFDVMDQTTSYVLIGAGVGVGCIAGGLLHGIAGRKRREANAIRVASIYEKEFKVKNISVSPGLKLMAYNNGQNLNNYSLGVGASIKF